MMWLASKEGERACSSCEEAGAESMSNFEEWASATFRHEEINFDATDLALVELIYSGALQQLEMLDHIDLDAFPARGIDLRHAPKAT